MRRRTLLQAGLGGAVSLVAGCAKKPGGGTPSGSLIGPLKPSDGSLPEKFLLTGGGKGLQLFFHGLCAFVQPKTGAGPLRVAMLKGYPDMPEHRHIASLVLPRDGVNLSTSTARPSAIDTDHLIYSLNDVFITLTYSTVGNPGLKVKKTVITKGCVDILDRKKWDDFGWVLDMTQFSDFASGTRRDWSKVPDVSQAQFEALHGSVEQDFDGKEQDSRRDLIEWQINANDRIVKQAARLRVHEQSLSFEIKPRSGGETTTIVLQSNKGVVNGAIINLPGPRKVVEQPGNRLVDALAYYQMLDPSPLGGAQDDRLGVPKWSNNPDHCTLRHSIECSCCPPSEV